MNNISDDFIGNISSSFSLKVEFGFSRPKIHQTRTRAERQVDKHTHLRVMLVVLLKDLDAELSQAHHVLQPFLRGGLGVRCRIIRDRRSEHQVQSIQTGSAQTPKHEAQLSSLNAAELPAPQRMNPPHLLI